ncbi:MAG: hypothetical protein V7K77_21155 [Nostoc sp.]|uniref:hypothetical protein n=1 Tax=Nostoc sp. TaxID=1180 RepID=UPI002FFC7637
MGKSAFCLIGDRSYEAVILVNIGVLLQNTNRPIEAINNLDYSYFQLNRPSGRGASKVLRPYNGMFVNWKSSNDT